MKKNVSLEKLVKPLFNHKNQSALVIQSKQAFLRVISNLAYTLVFTYQKVKIPLLLNKIN